MFKTNNKNTRTTSVSIVNFEQVNVSWKIASNTVTQSISHFVRYIIVVRDKYSYN